MLSLIYLIFRDRQMLVEYLRTPDIVDKLKRWELNDEFPRRMQELKAALLPFSFSRV